MLTRARAAWNRYWFSDTTRVHYGIFRILFLSGFFLLPELAARIRPSLLQGARISNLSAAGDIPEAFSHRTLFLRVLDLPLDLPSWVGPVLLVLAVLATIGLATRVTLVALAVGYLYAGSVLNSHGFIAHDTTFPTIVLLVLAVTPRVSACSVDSYLRARRRGERSWIGVGRPVPVWPARLLLVMLCLVYFSSGFAKVHHSGLAWADGKTIQAYATDPQPAPYLLAGGEEHERFRDGVGLQSFLYSSGRPTSLLKALAGNDLLMALLATSSLLWELTFPIVLFVRRLLPWYLGLGLLFHLSVALTFRLTSFYSYPLCYLVFVDWARVLGFVRRRWLARVTAAV